MLGIELLNDCLLKAKGSLRLLELYPLHGEEKREFNSILKLQYNELMIAQVLVKVTNDKPPNLQTLERTNNTFDEEIEAPEQINDIFDERGLGRLEN